MRTGYMPAGRAIGATGTSLQTEEDPVQLSKLATAFIAERYLTPARPDSATVHGAAEYVAAAA